MSANTVQFQWFTINCCPVTSEAQGSSPVDPAILLNGLQTYPLPDQGILGDEKRKTRVPDREVTLKPRSLVQLCRGQQARRQDANSGYSIVAYENCAPLHIPGYGLSLIHI